MKTMKQVASHNFKWQFCRCTFCLFFFPPSSKAINKAYEEYVLSVGNLDERIFLGEDAEEEIGTLSRCLNTGSGAETAERVQMKNILQQHFDKVSQADPREAARADVLRACCVLVVVCVCILLASSTKEKIHILPLTVERLSLSLF